MIERTECAVIGCSLFADPPHHIWYGRGNRVPCIFQPSRKSPRPGGILHGDKNCQCNLIPLCTYHHVPGAHEKGDLWLYENTQDERVRIKCELTGKI